MTRRVLVLLWVLMLVGAGCRKQQAASTASRIRIHRLDLQDKTAPENRVEGFTGEVLARWVRQKLGAASSVELLREAAPDAYQLTLELGVAYRRADPERPRERVVLISVRASQRGTAEGVDLQASAVTPLPVPARKADELPALQRAIDSVMDDLTYQARLAVAPPPQLAAALAAEKDVGRLAAAVEIAAVRRTREAVPTLLRLLRHSDERIADRAIGALASIGDERAIKPLTELSAFKDTAKMAKLLDAIGAIGGTEAQDYLEFVASGHEDADIRNLAAEALERLHRAEGARPDK